MRKITTKKETNEFYKIINDHIDDYINQWKIDPKNLKKYFSNKKKKEQFLSRTGLNDVEKIGVILDDVLEARDAMVRDKISEANSNEDILTFSSFFVNEAIKIETANTEHEKVLADLFRTSLSHIEIKNKIKNHFIVDDMGDKIEVSIFSDEDVDKFKKQIKELLMIESKEIDLDLYQVKVDDRNLKTKISLSLADVVDTDKLDNKLDTILGEKKLVDIITNWLNDYELMKNRKRFEFYKSYHNHLVWKLTNK